MTKPKLDYFVELRRPKSGTPVARARVAEAYFQPVIDDGLWRARRRSVISDLNSASWEVEPVFSTEGQRRVKGLSLCVEENGARFSREYSLQIFREPALDLARRLLREEHLKEEDDVETVVLAYPPQSQPASGADSIEVKMEVSQAKLCLTPGRLSDWYDRSTQLNTEAHCADDTPVFIQRRALEQARFFCRVPGALEGGALLVGLLYQQTEPEPEIFAVIDAAFEARHARQEKFSLTLTTRTYQDFERQLALRRKRLNRPEEMLLATAHAHNFAPSLDKSTGEPNCPGCPLRPSCNLNSAFFSPEDIQFHRALFVKQPFAIGLVWGLDPRFDDVLKVYGSRDGAFQERSLWVVN